MQTPTNVFKQALAEGRAQIGLWAALASPYSTELVAGTGYDWLLIDGEHAPNDVRSTLAQLQAVASAQQAFGDARSHAIVRVPVGTGDVGVALIKQHLDIGAQTLLVPMIDTPAQAELVVRATRYAPSGIRGMGSALARASRWQAHSRYVHEANDQVCVLVQAESVEAMKHLDEIAATMYLRTEQLAPGQQRVALKELHLNRCPALMAWQHLRQPDFERLGIDLEAVAANARRLQAVGPALAEKVRRVFGKDEARAPADADASLYDGFLADGDKRLFQDVRTTPPESLGERAISFRDPRLPELLFRYRARNWPATLTPEERNRWDDFRRRRLRGPVGLSEYTFESVRQELAELRARSDIDTRQLALLDQIEAWTDALDAGLS